MTRVGTLTGLFFSERAVTDDTGARGADHERYARLFHALLAPVDTGTPRVFFPPSGYETLFVSLAHTDADVDVTIDAVARAASALR